MEEEEEYIVESGSNGEEFELGAPVHDDRGELLSVFNTYAAVMYGAPASLDDSDQISLSIPTSFLPLSTQAVFGLQDCSSLLDITLALSDYDWTRRPKRLDISNKKHGVNYIGRALVDSVCHSFFTPEYRQRSCYRCEPYLLTPTGEADERKLEELVSSGYDKQKARNALVLCGNNEKQAVQFLRTGEVQEYRSQIVTGYSECPLLYLVLEIAECFIDLTDHCCICRDPLTPGVRPSVCDKALCRFQFTQLGIGNSVSQEIKNAPDVADLFIVLFAAAVGTDFLTPAPPGGTPEEYKNQVQSLPAIAKMREAENDHALVKMIGENAFDMLRWILLSNRSQLIRLENDMKLYQGPLPQFLTLISAPEAELEFQKLKAVYGSQLLFHGSHLSRWHSIIRNGLKNASGTPMQANGAAYGKGIYLASASRISSGYSMPGQNMYPSSTLGLNIRLLAVCEVCKVPSLVNVNPGIYTLQDEKAVICRFLLVLENSPFNLDSILVGQHIPTLKEILDDKARRVGL